MAKLREILLEKSWMKLAGAFVLYTLAVLAILYPFLFKGLLFYDLDVALQHYAFYQFFADAVKNGESFLWNPYIFSGFPGYASQTGMLDPVYWVLILFLDPIVAVHWRIFIACVSALFLTFIAARAYGLSSTASFLAGFAYLSSFTWQLLSDPIVANSVFLIPLLFYVFIKAAKNLEQGAGRPWWVWALLGGLGVGWAFLAGQVQVVVYSLFLLGIFAPSYFFFVFGGEKSRAFFFRFMGVFVVIVITGFLLGAPHIIPTLKLVPLTIRAHQLPYEVATIKSVEPGDLIGFLFPAFSYFPYFSPGQKYLYVGAFWFFLAVMGAFYKFRSRISVLFTALFGFAFISSLKWSPLFFLMWLLPVFNQFRAPYRWIQGGVFFLAVLGAYGFDNLETAISDRRVKKTLFVLGGVVGCITLSVLLLNFAGDIFWNSAGNIFKTVFTGIFYGQFGFNKSLAHYQAAFDRGIGAWRNFTSLSDPQFVLPFLLVVSGFGAIAAYVFGWIHKGAFQITGSAVMVLTFVGLHVVEWPLPLPMNSAVSSYHLLMENIIPPSEKMIYRTYPFLLASSFVEKRPPTFRLTPEERRVMGEFQYASGWPNTNMYAGVISVDGYDLLVPREYMSALFLSGSGHGGVDLADSTETVKQELFLKHIPLLGMMGGKYIISGVPLKSPQLTLIKEKRVTAYDLPLYIYKNSTALPRVYFAESLVELPGASIGDIVDLKGQDFKHYTYLDCRGCTEGRPTKTSEGKLGIHSLKNGLFDLAVDIKDSRWIVISESFLPGWQAKVDGFEATIVRANGLYMAVEIPKGKHRVTFEYNGIMGEAGILKKLGIIKGY